MNFAYSLLEKEAKQPVKIVNPAARDKSDEKDKKDRRLFCAKCGNPVTSADARIEVNGSAEHTFANPAGHIFHIGCFRNAPGCISGIHETRELTWFPGYAWSASLCSLCGTHLGWRFRGERDEIFGLILSGLVEKESSQD
jgi:hypothetical protein